MPTPNAIKTFWTPVRIISTVVVFSLVAIFAGTSCNSNEVTPTTSNVPSNPPDRNPPATNPSAPVLVALPPSVLEAEMKAASGPPIRLSNYAGKVLLVNLWATWCGPCRNETPELVRLHKEFHSRGVEFIGLSTENPEASAESVRAFVKNFNVDYQIGWATAQVALTLMQGRDSIPQSFIISREGRIVKRFVGFSPITTPPQLRQALEEALAAKG